MDTTNLDTVFAGALIIWGIVILCYGLFFGFVCNLVAKRKKLDGSTWAVFGFLFGIFALIGVAVVPGQPIASELARVRESPKTNWVALVLLAGVVTFIVILFSGLLGGGARPTKQFYIPGNSTVADELMTTPQWVNVAKWNGNGSKTTEKFTVGSEWKIVWDTKPGPYGAMNFQIYIYDDQGNISGVAANVIGSSSDESFQYQSGTYYLQFNTAQPYQVKVLELR